MLNPTKGTSVIAVHFILKTTKLKKYEWDLIKMENYFHNSLSEATDGKKYFTNYVQQRTTF